MTNLFEFEYHNPTRIIFGPHSIAKLPALIPPAARILMLYGGGSIKQNGIHAEVQAALVGRSLVEFGGVEPNPSLATLNRAVELVRAEQLDFILGVGGGSVMDGAKFVAAAALYHGDGWDIVSGAHTVTQALKVGVVATLAATGSESNAGAVITNHITHQKKVYFAPPAQPQFAILDPRVLRSLPDRQLQNGLVDAFVHVCEQYLTVPTGALVQDGHAESLLRALRTLAANFEKRHELGWLQNLMWAANQALTWLVGVGVPHDWATHRLAVELTTLYGIDHARTLSILQPWLLRETIEAKRAKLEQMGRHVFDLPDTSAEQTIAAIEALYRSLDMPVHLREAGIANTDAADRVMAAVRAHGNAALGGHAQLDDAKTARIVRAACSPLPAEVAR